MHIHHFHVDVAGVKSKQQYLILKPFHRQPIGFYQEFPIDIRNEGISPIALMCLDVFICGNSWIQYS